MRSKIIKIFLVVTFAQLFLYACCGDEYNVFVTAVELTAIDHADDDTTMVTNEDFSLSLESVFQTDMISSVIKQSGLLNMAYATSCDEEYHVINLITAIKVEANVPLFGIAAGDSLNEHVIAKYDYDVTGVFTVADMVSNLNNSYNINEIYSLVFDSAIPADTTTNFKITFTFENNTQLESTTSEVTFE